MKLDSTCWTVIHEAAAGCAEAREDFALRYSPLVLSYLRNRWRGSPLFHEVEDTAQYVFVECFRQGGVIERSESDRSGGFRAFFYGVIRNVALRTESRRTKDLKRAPTVGFDPDEVEHREASLSRAFDRAWARAILREAADRQAELAEQRDERARRRVEILRLRFHEGLPIRDIAKRWDADTAAVHREYAAARREFRAVLLDVVSLHHPGSARHVEQECVRLLDLLS